MTAARRVLVTDASRGSAIAVIRSLAGRGWEVTAADDSSWSPGLRSKHTTNRLVYPSPLERPDDAARALLRTVQRRKIGLVVPVTDESILAIRRMRLAFEAITTLALASDAALDVAASKVATQQLAERLGIPAPKSRLVTTPGEAVAAARELGWPLVVKPQQSRSLLPDGTIARHSVWYATDTDAIVASLPAGPQLLQQFVPGEGHGVELLLGRDGGLVAAFQHRRLREVPVTGGASSYRESVPLDPTLLEYSLALLREIGWTGLAMVEFRVGPQGARLMEVNGRIWGSLPLAVQCGVDFPALMADVHTGRTTERSTTTIATGASGGNDRVATYPIGVRSRSLPLEVAWIGAVLFGPRRRSPVPWPRRRDALGVAVGMLSRGGWDVQSRTDPVPGIVQIGRVLLAALGRFRPRSARPIA